MSDRSDRKAELERKKARLAQIRAEKQKKAPPKKVRRSEGKYILRGLSSDLDKKRKETEDLLRTVGIDYSTTGNYVTLLRLSKCFYESFSFFQLSPSPATPVSPKKVQERDGGDSQCNSMDWDLEPSLVELQGGSIIPSWQPKATKLAQSKITLTSIPPKEVVTYSKECQTPVETQQPDSEGVFFFKLFPDERENVKDVAQEKEDRADELSLEEEEQQLETAIRELSEQEKEIIESSDDFVQFLSRSSRFMDRALSHRIDLFTEYSSQVEEESEVDRGMKLSINRIFSDERWSRHRMVTSLDWSTHVSIFIFIYLYHPELCLASYGNNEEAPYEPEGVALVWNSKYKTTTPEYTFHCQSSVTSACFAKFHPNLVIGGTYSGQIVMWDNRSNKRTAQRSKLSTAAHTHPVYCMDVVGTQNAHNLISVSTDGKMCSWSLDMLTQPLEAMELQHKQSKSVAVMSMAFQLNNVNNFAIGAEDGSLYTACRHGSKTGINELYEGHSGPVSGIDFHRSSGQLDFSHLLLTSSFDWTIKLWSLKVTTDLFVHNLFNYAYLKTVFSGSRTCLHSFQDHSDCVYDVAWSPVHPSLFASGDCSGRLDLWNMNSDTEVPVVSTIIDSAPAINKLRWNSTGNHIAIGDSTGRVHLCDVGEVNLSSYTGLLTNHNFLKQLSQPRPDEWTRFVRSLTDIRNSHQEEEEARN
uniref:Uncharacterized protein n=1 Tax=Ciona savignyi TaxID=51511 RepID=H2YZR2_CIOSA